MVTRISFRGNTELCWWHQSGIIIVDSAHPLGIMTRTKPYIKTSCQVVQPEVKPVEIHSCVPLPGRPGWVDLRPWTSCPFRWLPPSRWRPCRDLVGHRPAGCVCRVEKKKILSTWNISTAEERWIQILVFGLDWGSLFHSPTFQPLGDQEHGCSAHIFGKETFECTKLSLTYDVVEGGQGLASGSVHVGRYEVHEPIIGPLTPLHLLSENRKHLQFTA